MNYYPSPIHTKDNIPLDLSLSCSDQPLDLRINKSTSAVEGTTVQDTEVQDTSVLRDTSVIRHTSEFRNTSEFRDTSVLQYISERGDTSVLQHTSVLRDTSELRGPEIDALEELVTWGAASVLFKIYIKVTSARLSTLSTEEEVPVSTGPQISPPLTQQVDGSGDNSNEPRIKLKFTKVSTDKYSVKTLKED